ncbi:hypothetical protein STEG23_015402 [Scotinomys teguina]
MEFYESTYFVVLIPSVVITVIFLFFWLFMKETLYDEVLAKQKREQKLISTKTDKKKAEKKKNKKKEVQNGAIHESDSENIPRDFKLSDTSAMEEEQFVPAPLNVFETSSGVRERKKKEKKQKPSLEEQIIKESDTSKIPGKKVEPVLVTQQPAPPPETAALKRKAGQKKSKSGSDDQDKKVEMLMAPSKKQDTSLFHQETKQEGGLGKKKGPSKKQKTENVLVDEPLIHATTYIPLMDNANSNLVMDKREIIDMIKPDHVEEIHKSGAKKLKIETDKENAEVKFKDFLLSLKTMVFSEDEALCVVDLLKEKSGVIKDAVKKSNKGELSALLHQLQEKERLLSAVKEDATATKERCKQLTQEMMTEKERSSVVIARMKDRIVTLEKEHNVFQNKMHVNYQETQQMQMKFQQVREQMEAEIAHLKQENGILRDAVSNTTNQLESKQTAELNKLRQDCGRLVSELNEKTGKLQQEGVQKKNAEQAATQLKVQLQEAERRWEEVQSYIRKRTAEHEAAQQDLQSKFVAKENEVQSLHSKLTDTLVSKQQLEQRLMQLMESEQKRASKEESLQIQVQVSFVSLIEELRKAIHEKDGQIKSVEELLEVELLRVANKEKTVQALKQEIEVLKEEIGNAQLEKAHQLSVSSQVQELQNLLRGKEEQVSTLKAALEDKDRDLTDRGKWIQDLQEENESLKADAHEVAQPGLPEVCLTSRFEELENMLKEKDNEIKRIEAILKDTKSDLSSKSKLLEEVQDENKLFKSQVERLSQQNHQQASFPSQEELQTVISEKEKELTDLRNELDSLKNAVEHQRKKNNERQQHVEAVELESKELLRRLFPMVSVPSHLTYTEWLRGFEKKAKACVAGASDAETVKILEHRLKEADEMHTLLQLECEKYKSVLAETEGILQKLQRSVEQEESKWKTKADESQRTIKQMQSSFTSSEQELERLRRENKDVEHLRQEREHLEMELEKAEIERSTYVTEVRELKTQLNETLTKLQNEQSERKKVADDLHKAQQSLNLIHSRISLKVAGDSAVIENSAVSPETGSPEKETMSVSLNQTVTQLQQLLQEVNQQLMKEK